MKRLLLFILISAGFLLASCEKEVVEPAYYGPRNQCEHGDSWSTDRGLNGRSMPGADTIVESLDLQVEF